MENVILVIHLLLALGIIVAVLLQRSEGGGLGIGGGGNGAGSSRPAQTATGKATWIIAIAFICTSITLTIIAANNSAGDSVIERLGGTQSDDGSDNIDSLLPPSPEGEPLVPSAQ